MIANDWRDIALEQAKEVEALKAKILELEKEVEEYKELFSQLGED